MSAREPEDLQALCLRLQERLSAAERRQAELTQALELTRRASLSLSLPALLQELAAELQAAPDVDGYLINLIDDEHKALVCRGVRLPAEFRQMEAPLLEFRYPLEVADINVEAFQCRHPVRLTEAEGYSDSMTTRFLSWQLQVASVPLHDRDLCVGTVTLLGREGWSEQRLAALRERLMPMTLPLRNAQRHSRLERRLAAVERWADEQQRFFDFVNEINSLKEADKIYQLIAEEFIKRYPVDLVCFLRRDGEHLFLREVITRVPEQALVRDQVLEHFARHPFWLGSGDGATPVAFLQHSAFFFRDVQDVLHLPMADKDRRALEIMQTPRTFFIVPITFQGEPIGILWLMSLEKVFDLSEAERHLIKTLCAFLGAALCNAELFARTKQQKQEAESRNLDMEGRLRQLDELASRDRLTGLLNYGAFTEALELSIAQQEAHPATTALSLAIVDVDHFKRFNDTHGHAAGNEVLQRVAQRLQKLSRQMDVVCRYGGEEFVVILPTCDADGARIIGERIRYDIESHGEAYGEHITASVGAATHRAGESARELFERADQALYRAKESGRNRVVSAD